MKSSLCLDFQLSFAAHGFPNATVSGHTWDTSGVAVCSAAPGVPQEWGEHAWRDAQINYFRDGIGNVSCMSVWLGGLKQDLNVSPPPAFAFGLGSTVPASFHIDAVGGDAVAPTYLAGLGTRRR